MNRLAWALFATGWLVACTPNRTILDPPLGSADVLPQAGPVQLQALKSEAESWIGAPYRLGGNERNGIDCSGFVHNVFMILGLDLPRTVETLYEFGRPIHRRKLRMADLVFFRFKGREGPTHVGIYLGGEVFIHASVGRGVRLDTLGEGAYAEHFHGGRRILA